MGGMQLLSRVLTRHSAHHRKPYRSAAFSITRGIRTSSALFQSTQPGHVYVWGGNREAFGSIEGVDDTREPVHLNTFQQPASKISCGSTQTAILTTDGQVYTAGKCEHFSLGHGDGEENKIVSTPRLVETLQGIKIVDIDMGDHHCAAVSEEGEVFTWGYGGGMFNPGGLGHGDKTSQSRPALVEALADQGIKIKQVSCGAAHTIALDEEGKVYTWGRGDFGRLGNGIQPQLTPEPVELLENEKMIQVSAGKEFSAVLSDGGTAYLFGKNDQSQLGLGANIVMDLNTMEQYPAMLGALRMLKKQIVLKCIVFSYIMEGNGYVTYAEGQVAMIEAGGHHCIALTRDGKVFTWGARVYIEPAEREEFNDLPDGEHATYVTAGEGTNAVITSKGRCFTWGKNLLSGALGQPGRTGKRQPAILQKLEDLSVSQLSLGNKHGGAILGEPPTIPVVPRQDEPEQEEEGFFASIFK